MKSSRTLEEELKRFRPEQPRLEKKDLSSYFPKDELFKKKKSYFITGKTGQKEMECDWKKINLQGFKIVLFKGCAISNEDIKHFNKEAKEHYLNQKRAKKEVVNA